MLRSLPVEDWLTLEPPIIDVRSPGEFARGHIPGAHNVPLFTNEERAIVGTLYKQKGRDPAVLEGLRLVGPKLAWLVEEAQRLAPTGRIRVHCWRGGERSGSVGWLLDKAGFVDVFTLKRGYKGFRAHAQATLRSPFLLKVLGGFTGSGKTESLKHLGRCGAQVVDLEALADHKGSAFGALGQLPQPTTEHFENRLWSALAALDPSRPIWVEDESAMIGRVNVPSAFFAAMRAAPLYFVEVPQEERAKRLVEHYGHFPKEQLAGSIQRIAKRMGPQHCKNALLALDEGDLEQVALLALRYYDKAYLHGASLRDPMRVIKLTASANDPEALARQLNELP
ncbi:MAG: tRNA 2-selenouridine(34) synthase MnmH [Flavobacteriales bacterium]|nr:tRNA 2-selenouridine(34) synthase MnmH [Flavobacteriales bacterium]